MHNITNGWIWGGFSVFIIFALTVDMLLIEKSKKIKGPHTSMKASLYWSLLWVSLAFIFNGLLWIYLYNTSTVELANTKSLEFLAGYLIEKSLSVDNLFVFFMIFHQFRIPPQYQQRIFNYGIWGAVIMRLILILIGTWLVTQFHWILSIMGAFLLLTGVKMFFFSQNEKDLAQGFLFRFLKNHMRLTHDIHGEHFFIVKDKLWYATPLFLAVILIEISDLIFAFDSIPAIFAITQDPFIVWTSNIFAILGLRALYFLLAGMANRFVLLKYGIAMILVFVGGKMLVEPWVHVTTLFSLGIVIGILVSFVLMSYLFPGAKKIKGD